MDGQGVETFEEDIVFTVGTLVVEGVDVGHVFLFVIFVLVVVFKQERGLVQVVLRLLVVATVDGYSFVFFFFVDDIQFVDLYLGFSVALLRFVALCRYHYGQRQKSK